MEKLDFNHYKDKSVDYIHEMLLRKVLELVQQIIIEKGIDLDKYSYIDSYYDRLIHMFYYDVFLCSDIQCLLNTLGKDYQTNTYFLEDTETWFFQYNNLVEEFNNYMSVKNEINKRGYDVVYQELEDKIKNLCIEMLEYKNKDFDRNASLFLLLKKVEQYYQTQILTIHALRSSLIGFAEGANIDEDSKRLDHAERIMESRGLYEYLKSNYQEDAFLYRDYELKEGETFSDIHIRYLYRSYDLYREMLEFLKVEYDKDKPPIHVIDLVKKYYPYYEEYIDDKNKPYFDPYASSLTRMDEYYEYMKDHYKIDFINEINKYQKYKFHHPEKSMDDIINELNLTKEECDKIEEFMNEEFDVEEKKDYEMDDDLYEVVCNCFDELNDQEKELLDYRFGIVSFEKHSVDEASVYFKLSRVQILQIEARAIRKIRKGMV